MKFQCPKDVKLPVYILFILFGMGSWIAVNGLWVELPILVNEAPEGWNLPSYFVILIQIANIGPLMYTIINRLVPKYFNEKHGIIIIIVLGSAACLMLVFIWKETAYVAGAERSVGLLVCVFLLSFVDCTSTVVFLGYMAFFKIQYVSAMFIGNGMSGLVPGIVALIQNVGQTLCLNQTVNATTNETAIVSQYVQPNFPVEDFFYLLFGIMVLCGVSFLLLQYLPYCKTEHITGTGSSYNVLDNWLKSEKEFKYQDNSTIGTSIKGKAEQDAPGVYVNYVCDTDISGDSSSVYEKKTDLEVSKGEEESEHKQAPLTRKDYVVLLLIISVINGLKNGVVPSLSSYSTLPYGNTVFLLAATLMSIMDPIACVVAFVFPIHSLYALTTTTVVGSGLAAYIVVIASYSPVPPMVGETIGSVLIVSFRL